MKDDDEKTFLDDFKSADISKKLDMWFFAMGQEALWEEIMDEMSKIQRMDLMKSGAKPSAGEE